MCETLEECRRPIRFSHWQAGRDYQVIESLSGDFVLFLTTNNRVLRVSPSLGRRLRVGLDRMTCEEAAEWDALADSGLIADVNAARVGKASIGDGANLAININLTATCNLGCSYCFADGGDYGRITGKLGADIAEDIFHFVKQRLHAGQTVRFEFFGGEPLLNFERIAQMCERADEISRTTGIRFIYRISTNLTKLPNGAVELLERYAFIVSVSIDGDRQTHDRNRPTKNGGGSWDRIVSNCRKLRAAGDDVTMVARMTVLGGSNLVENVRALWSLNMFDYFQVYPGVVPAGRGHVLDGGSGPTGRTMSALFLAELADFVREYPGFFSPDNRFCGVLEYERLVDMVLSGKAALSFCSGGRNYFTFSPDRSIMPCHRLVGDAAMAVGESADGLTKDSGLAPWRLPVDQNPVCSQCWIRYVCAGGCRQENLQATGNLNKPSPEGCRYQIQLVENVVAMLAQQDAAYRGRRRDRLDDMFVSCGRPLILNLRDNSIATPLVHAHHFRAL